MSWLVVSPGEARPAVKYAPLGPLTVFQQWRRREPGTRFLDLDGREEIRTEDLPLAGISGVAIACMGGDLLRRAERVTAAVREAAPEVPVVWGGAFPTSFPKAIAASMDVDALIAGPAPPAPPHLGPRVPGRQGSACVLPPVEALHAPDIDDYFDGLDAGRYVYRADALLKADSLPVITSRGCPFRCTFCHNTHTEFPSPYDGRPPKAVAAQAGLLAARYGVEGIYLQDDYFGGTRRFVAIAQAAPAIRSWFADVTAEDLTPPNIDTLASHGLRACYVGVESGSERIRASLGKHLPLARVRQRIEYAVTAGIKVIVSLIFGSPGETPAELQDTLRFIADLPAFSFDPHPFCPFPGTPLWETLRRAGRLRLPSTWEQWRGYGSWCRPFHNYSECPDELLAEAQGRALERNAELWRTRSEVPR
jgi:radical SAM superfamily enzyme YgiQ (UPF0313 family)